MKKVDIEIMNRKEINSVANKVKDELIELSKEGKLEISDLIKAGIEIGVEIGRIQLKVKEGK